MPRFKLHYLVPAIALILTSGCTMFNHGDDPNYTLCKSIQGKIQFGTNTTSTYTGTAAENDEADRRRLQTTYDKLDCSKYHWLTF